MEAKLPITTCLPGRPASLPQQGGSQEQQGPQVPGELRSQRIKAQLPHVMTSSSQAPLHTAGAGPAASCGGGQCVLCS